MGRVESDGDWEREARLDRAFEHEPRTTRPRFHPIGARVRTAMVGAREETSMLTCPCKFIAATGVHPASPAWHRAHRAHHLKVYPRVPQSTRDALDQLVDSAERKLMVAEAQVS